MATQQDDTYSGTWYCRHWYPNKDDTGEDMTKNRMKGFQKGRELILESEANAEGSYMFVKLSIDGDQATGAWHETTSPTGSFESANYSGAGQLIISDDQQSMEGMWAGVGYDRKLDKKRVYTGRWELARTE
jgi:hypothetical protein